MGSVALVFAGGDPPPPHATDGLPVADLIVAADSGLHHAIALGYRVDVVVGDLDSADPAALDAAVASGASIVRHPEAKDATDLDLALDVARREGCNRVIVVGGHGGRLDHFVANILLLASPRLARIDVEARVGDARVFVVRTRCELTGRPGDVCTLLPLGGPALGVRTENLRFPLRGETLDAGSTRGVSNQLLSSSASVALDAGVLLAILPPSEGTTS
ncbi:MAG TPA: thiamine diphosphokinase [Acidimicrobiia bacterium]|jgi:thiamine pyrophosphokinase